MSLHAEALYELLVRNPVDIFDSPFSHSRIAVTSAILEDYENVFFTNPQDKQTYLAFVQAMTARIKSVRPVGGFTNSTLLGDYFSSSRSGGRYLALGAAQQLCDTAVANLEDIGVRAGPFPALLENTASHGFSPFETHHLVHGQRFEPSGLLRFFRGEDRVTVYDRYINDDSIGFLNAVLEVASQQCSMFVLTSRKAPLTIGEILASIVRGPGQQVSARVVADQTARQIHDRHIFISSDVEMHFTRGLDCFGRRPSWVNSAGSVYIFDTSLGNDFSFNIVGPGRPVRVKSCVIK